jgi:uncharacterized membrane protein (UPF0127 family)
MRLGWAFVLVGVACTPAPEPADPSDPAFSIPPMPTVPASGSASTSTPPPSTAGRCIMPMAATPPRLPGPATRCPADPKPATLPTAELSFENGLKIQAELAKNEHDIQKGLMYRRSMSDTQGMFFKLDSRRDHQFWMHNTCIPLDMLFIEDDGLIVGMVEGAAPLTDSVRSCGCPSSFVLEVNAGWARKNGVRPGQRITIPSSAR